MAGELDVPVRSLPTRAAQEKIYSAVSLIVKCFEKRRIWIPQVPTSVKPLPEKGRNHPFIARVESQGQIHTATVHLDPGAFYLRDHVVAGSSMLPGAAMLEMARAAGAVFFS